MKRFEKILDWATMAGAAFGLVVTIAVITGLSFDLARAQFQPNPGTTATPPVPGESCGARGEGVPHGDPNACVHGFTGAPDLFFGHVGIRPNNSGFTPTYVSGGGGSVANLAGSDNNFTFTTSMVNSTSVTFAWSPAGGRPFQNAPACTVTLNVTAAGAPAITTLTSANITVAWPTTSPGVTGWVHCFGYV